MASINSTVTGLEFPIGQDPKTSQDHTSPLRYWLWGKTMCSQCLDDLWYIIFMIFMMISLIFWCLIPGLSKTGESGLSLYVAPLGKNLSVLQIPSEYFFVDSPCFADVDSGYCSWIYWGPSLPPPSTIRSEMNQEVLARLERVWQRILLFRQMKGTVRTGGLSQL